MSDYLEIPVERIAEMKAELAQARQQIEELKRERDSSESRVIVSLCAEQAAKKRAKVAEASLAQEREQKEIAVKSDAQSFQVNVALGKRVATLEASLAQAQKERPNAYEWPLHLFCENHIETTLADANVNDPCPLCTSAAQARREGMEEAANQARDITHLVVRYFRLNIVAEEDLDDLVQEIAAAIRPAD